MMDEEKIAKLTVPEILNIIRRLLEELELRATSLSPGKIDGWVILASAGGAATHTVGKMQMERLS